MTRFRTAAAALLVLLGAGLLVRITDRAGEPPKKAEPIPVASGMAEGPPDLVDPKTGNIHLQIPIPTVHKKPTAPRSGH